MLAAESYTLARRLPASERFELSAQLRRAAVSVAANIAEGWGRGSRPAFRQFLFVARGSLLEVETLLLIATRVNLLTTDDCRPVLRLADEVSRMLNALLRALKEK